MTVPGPQAARDAEGHPRTAATDLVILVGLAVALNLFLLSVSTRYAGPVTAVCTLALATLLLRWRGLAWRDLGLRPPDRPWWLLLQVPAVLIGSIAVGAVTGAVVGQFAPAHETASRFGDLAGNLPATLWWITIGWLVGGFAEEMIFRGFLLHRVEALMPPGRPGTLAAVVAQAALFGAVHAYNRGVFGLLTIGTVGLCLGGLYLLFRRNLWPLIIAHGLVDTLSFLEDYFG